MRERHTSVTARILHIETSQIQVRIWSRKASRAVPMGSMAF